MTKRSGISLFSWFVCASALAVGCGGSDSPGGGGGTSGVGVLPTAGAGAGIGGGISGNGAAGINGNIGGTTGGSGIGGGGTGGTGAGGDSGGCVGTAEECMACRDTAEGVYAMKVELDVWWVDEVNTTGELADPGRGKINIYFRGDISEIDDTTKMGKGKMHPCGVEMPPFVASASCAAIQIEFPDTLWDNAAVPDYETTGSTTGFGVGDILTVTKTAGFLGLSLDSTSTPFPTYMDTPTLKCAAGTGTLWTNGQAPTMQQAPCFPDQDGDGKPGVTVTFKRDGSTIAGPGYGCPNADDLSGKFKFLGAPLGLGSIIDADTNFAKEGWIGLQTELGGSGKIKDGCMSGVGSATSGAGLPSRVLHCLDRAGTNCTQDLSGFLDKNTPNYHILQKGEIPPADKWKFQSPLNSARQAKLDKTPSLGPRSSVIRLGDLGTQHACGDVRSAAFLPFE